MTLFSFPRFKALDRILREESGLKAGHFRIGRFANHELSVTLDTPVAGRECMILGTIAPPDENLTQLLLLCHTMGKEQAAEVDVLLPYLAYARQDKEEEGKSLGAAWIGEALKASGATNVVTVDVHSARVHELFPIPLISLSPAPLFADFIDAHGLLNATLIAPDEGAIHRCTAVQLAAGMEGPLTYFRKTRTPEGEVHSELKGEVGEQVIIVDDILDTGVTLVTACEALVAAGAMEITIFVTHGLFTGTLWQRLWDYRVKQIVITDTIPASEELISEKIWILSIAPLIQHYLVKSQEEHNLGR